MRLRLYGEYNEEEDKRGEERDAGAEGDGRRGETQRDGEEENGGESGGKITHGATVGSEETHVGCCSRSASAASQDCAVR